MGGSVGDDGCRHLLGVDADRFTHLCIATGRANGGVGKPAGGRSANQSLGVARRQNYPPYETGARDEVGGNGQQQPTGRWLWDSEADDADAVASNFWVGKTTDSHRGS